MAVSPLLSAGHPRSLGGLFTYTLGNPVIEASTGNGMVAAASCISCYNYASFRRESKPTTAATNKLPFNPTDNLIPDMLDGSLKFDFMWDVLLAP